MTDFEAFIVMNLNYFRECVTNSEFLCAKPFNQRILPDRQIYPNLPALLLSFHDRFHFLIKRDIENNLSYLYSSIYCF